MSTIIDSLDEHHWGQGLLVKMMIFLRHHTLSQDSFMKLFTSLRNPARERTPYQNHRFPFKTFQNLSLLAMILGVRGFAWCSVYLSGSRGFVWKKWLRGPSPFHSDSSPPQSRRARAAIRRRTSPRGAVHCQLSMWLRFETPPPRCEQLPRCLRGCTALRERCSSTKEK